MGLILAIGIVQVTPAWAADRTGKSVLGTPYTWTTPATSGFNINYNLPPNTPLTPRGVCTRDLNTYCETLLVEFHNPLTAEEIEDGKTKRTANAILTASWTKTDFPNDFDLYLYESDASGTQGAFIASDHRNYEAVIQSVGRPVVTTVEKPSVYVLLHVVYFSVVDTAYNGTATLSGSITT
jgi:hypothetical protein